MINQEEIILELEQILIPYATQRFDIKNNPVMDAFLSIPGISSFAEKYYRIYMDLITWLARAFVRTLVTANAPMYLSDITTVVWSEALFMLNYPPYFLISQSNDEGGKADLRFIVEGEIHRWFLFLLEQGKLPLVGSYHRYMGLFTPKRKQ